MIVNAPPPEVFAQVNDFRKWDDWSPWAEARSRRHGRVRRPARGPGAVFKWAGNAKIGQGTMTLVANKPGEFVRVDVEFVKPFDGPKAPASSPSAPQGDRTQVTWTVLWSDDVPWSKAMCLIMNMEKVLGPDMEKGWCR